MGAALTGPWGLAAAGVGAAGSLFGGKGQADATKEAANTQAAAAEKAAQIQADAQQAAAKLQAETAAQTLAFEQQQAQQGQANAITAQNANYGQWGYRQGIVRPYQQTGLNAQNTLGQMLGLPASSTALPDIPPPPQFTTVPPSGSGSAGLPAGRALTSAPDASAVISAIHGGQSPQAAIDAVNKAQNLPSGASYAWRSIPGAPGGGVVEVPNSNGSYLTPNPQGVWGIVQGNDSGSSAAPSPTIGSYAGLPSGIAPTPLGPGTTMPFVPMSIGSYV